MQLPAYERDIVAKLRRRLAEKRLFIQVINGPRQSGKTTAILQVLESLHTPYVYASADDPGISGYGWIETHWEQARLKASGGKKVILVFDEIQKIHRWDEAVKSLWDADTRSACQIHVVLLGSASLLMQAGLKESLAGRFEIVPCTHWLWHECRDCFGWELDRYVYFGGYPGAVRLIGDQERWARYIRESLIETTISRDVLLLNRVEKPALLHQLFYLACEYAGQIFSYNKMLGQLTEAGNTTTLAHYQSLLEEAYLLRGLQKYCGTALRRRGSPPKWIPLNNAMITAISGKSFEEWRENRTLWGRLVENAVGAHLLNLSYGRNYEIYYWREHDCEVDFVVRSGDKLIAIEVKAGQPARSFSGIESFKKLFNPLRVLVVGSESLSVREFLESDIERYFRG